MLGWLRQLVRPQRSLENPALSLNDPETWDAIGAGGMSDAGVRVSHTKSLGLAAVWQALSMISGDIAKLPLELYEHTSDRERERKRNHYAAKLVRRRPNEEMSAFVFWRTMMVHALLWGNGYAFIDRDGRGRAVGLYPLLPDRTSVERKGGKLVAVTETGGRLHSVPYVDVLHIRGVSLDGMTGCDLVEHARDSWGLAVALQGFASKFFANGVRTGGILELPASMKPATQDKVEEGFRKGHTGKDNWFKTVILRDGAKFHQTTVAPDEGQMIESREEQIREMARWFNLAPSRLGLSDSVSYNSKSEDNQAYLDSTLSPWLCGITSECDLKLLDDIESETMYFEHTTAALLRMNTIQRYQVYAIGVQHKILTRNECRGFENLSPVEGGDEFDSSPAQPTGGADKGGVVPPRGEADQSGGQMPVINGGGSNE